MPPPPPPSGPLHGLRILVVEDQFLIGELACDMLMEAGADAALVAVNGAQAVNLLQQPPRIDAVVIDINLGNESGYQLAEKLRGGVPFVFATGYESSAIAPVWRAIPHVAKPFTAEILVSALIEAIAAARRRD